MRSLAAVPALLLAVTLTLPACGSPAQTRHSETSPPPTAAPLQRALVSDASPAWDQLRAWSLSGDALVTNPNQKESLSVVIEFRFLSPEREVVASCRTSLTLPAETTQDASCLLGDLGTIDGLVFYIPRPTIAGQCYPNIGYCDPGTRGGGPLKVGTMQAALINEQAP